MRFPRAIRLDLSDTNVYEVAAEPGEWVVSGAFAFSDADEDSLEGKARQAFVHGFLGTASFGWTTFVEIAEIGDDEHRALIERLAAHFVDRYGAPDLETARPVARAEAAFAESLCEEALHSLLAVRRHFGSEGIVERFKVVRPSSQETHAKIWTIVDDEEGQA